MAAQRGRYGEGHVQERTYLDDKPPAEVDTADFLGSIREARREGEDTYCEREGNERRGEQPLERRHGR